jgi:hypothetical protein
VSRSPPARTSTAASASAAARPAPPADPRRAAVDAILDRALAAPTAYARLAQLTDGVGHRLSGSPALDKAVAWAVATFTADRHEAVRAEKVMVPRWERGAESGEITAPIRAPLHLLALGGSAGTPPAGLTAEVISLPDFAALGPHVKGKIVLFDHAMPPFGPGGTGYGETVVYRAHGPARAAKLGAVATLVRSVTARSLRTPHTGSTSFEDGQPPIPAAAVSVEDAALITRLCAQGPVTVRLTLGARTLPDVPSANVIAELRGREAPDEIVLIGAHLDSWDVGQGAHDDGAGVAMVIDALRVLRELDRRPRRTVRAVLYTNEENGLRGAKAYADAHGAEPHAAAIEADTGAFAPTGFYADANPAALPRLRAMAALLSRVGATEIEPTHHSGADLSTLASSGVTLLGLRMDLSTYFDYHHSHADTLDKVDPALLQQDVAALAAMAFLLADEPEPLPRADRPPPAKR